MEDYAQKYANTCPMGHNPKNFHKKIGENLFWTSKTENITEIIVEAIDRWAAELKECGFDFDKVGVSRMKSNAKCSFRTVGHWTQVNTI